MLKMLRVLTASLLLVPGAPSNAQLAPSDPVAFKKSVRLFQKARAQWMASLTAIKLDELHLSYSEGHVIEQNIGIAVGNLELAGKIADQVLASGDLSDEINFMSTLQELSHGAQDVSTLLLGINTNDAKESAKIIEWSKVLSDETNGPMNDLYVSTYHFVTSRADELEKKPCASTGKKP